MTERFAELVARCNGSVTLEVNAHRESYETVEEWMGYTEDVHMPAPEIVNGMVSADTTVSLQFYPSTPIAFHFVMHHDVDAAIEEAHELLDSEVDGHTHREN